MSSLSRAAFEALVADTLDHLPAPFQPFLDNVVVQVRDWPDEELCESLGLGEDETLYGIYLGTPLTERGHDPTLPDRILIFRGPILEDFRGAEAIEAQVRITVIHEIAHHFGIGEERLRELGWD